MWRNQCKESLEQTDSQETRSLLFNFNVLRNTLSAEVQTATNPLHTSDPRKDVLKLQMTADPQLFDSSQHLKQHFLRNSGQSIEVPVTAGSLK